MTAGRPQNIVRSLRMDRNGFEAWRLIAQEFEPPSDQRRYVLAMEISQGKPFTGDMNMFSSQLLQWEEMIDQ